MSGLRGAGLQRDLGPGQVSQLLAQLLLVSLGDQEVVAAGGDDVLGVGALGVHRVGGDGDAAQVDPVQQWGEGEDFVALRSDLALGDHGLAGVERGGEQVDGCAVGAGSAHRLAVHGQADLRAIGLVDRVAIQRSPLSGRLPRRGVGVPPLAVGLVGGLSCSPRAFEGVRHWGATARLGIKTVTIDSDLQALTAL